MNAPEIPQRKIYNADDAAIAFGGVIVPIKRKIDGGVVAEEVKVRLLAIDLYGELFRVADNEFAFADFICDKPEGWSRELAPGSVVEIADAGMDLNFLSACRWAARRARASQASKGMEEMIMRQMGPLLELFASVSRSSKSGPRGK